MNYSHLLSIVILINSYTSAYPDTDKYFGSKGNFFQVYKELFKKGGSFEANPPFLEEHMIILSSIIIEELKINENPLSFIVIYPFWEDAISYKMLLDSEYNVLHDKVLLFEKGEHKYIQSSQFWNRLSVDRVSNSKSSVFILQNKSGREKYKVTQDVIDKIVYNFKN